MSKVEIQLSVRRATPDQTRANLTTLVGAPIREIKVTEIGTYELTLGSPQDAKAYLGLNGRCLAGHAQPILATPKDYSLGVLDIFELVHKKTGNMPTR